MSVPVPATQIHFFSARNISTYYFQAPDTVDLARRGPYTGRQRFGVDP
jgi:hypothetical protein